MAIVSVGIAILILILLVTWAKLHPFLAFLVTSVIAAIMLDVPIEAIPSIIEKGMGGLLGALTVIICFRTDLLQLAAFPCLHTFVLEVVNGGADQWDFHHDIRHNLYSERVACSCEAIAVIPNVLPLADNVKT